MLLIRNGLENFLGSTGSSTNAITHDFSMPLSNNMGIML